MKSDAQLLKEALDGTLCLEATTSPIVIQLQAMIPLVALGEDLSEEDRRLITKCIERFNSFKADTYGRSVRKGSLLVAKEDAFYGGARLLTEGKQYQALDRSSAFDTKNHGVPIITDRGNRAIINTKAFVEEEG